MLSLAACLLLACTAVHAAPPTLADYTIVVKDPDNTTTFAAQELSEFIGNLTGKPLPIVNDSTTPKPPLLVVGYEACVAHGVKVDGVIYGPESFVISALPDYSVGVTGIGGSSHTAAAAHSRGTLYGAYEVLRSLGVSFIAWDFTALPSPPPTTMPPDIATVFHNASFEYRDSDQWAGDWPTWAARTRLNAFRAADRGAGIDYASPPGFVHTSYSLFGANTTCGGRCPPQNLFKTNNEWFWPHDDPSAYGQLCWSNQSLIAYLTERVRLYLRQQPLANIISVSQNDNINYCKDPGDMKIIKEEGSPIGPILRAVNQIANAIKDEFPLVAVDTLAYQYTRPAPKITRPEPNVIIRLCSIECNFAAPLTDPSNAPFQTDITNWSKISNRTYIWNYVTNFANFVMPFPNWYVLGPNIQFFGAHGVKGMFEEGSYLGAGGDMGELKEFVMSHMMWNNSLSSDDLIGEFLDAYYGDAAPFVRLYMDIMHGSIADTGYYMHESFDWNAPFLTPVSVLSSATAFVEALALKTLTPDSVAHLQRAKLPVYYVLLLRWAEMQSFASDKGYTWPIESTKQDAYNEFVRVYQLNGITHLSEGGNNLTWFHEQVFGS